ncbi:peroxiredoxin family protein [Daejeonella sp.]|uniref:peroxiredoxin family protein n=1 Tax=Daejeonella sp. TaxID=2805397 RepID=UPI003983D270
MRKFLYCSLIFLGMISATYAQSGPAQIVPDFTFNKFNGQAFSRKDLAKNKKIVIVFFDVSCDHCQNELKAISEKIDNFKTAEFYLISMDNVAAIQSFMKKFAPKMNGRVNVTLLRDLNRQFIVRFRPIQFPATYVYGTNLKLIKYFGQNSKVADIITAVNK